MTAQDSIEDLHDKLNCLTGQKRVAFSMYSHTRNYGHYEAFLKYAEEWRDVDKRLHEMERGKVAR